MQVAKTVNERLREAKQLENAGQAEDAARIYESIMAKDPANAEAVARLLIIYRKQKDYRRELAVINGALAAHEKQSNEVQQKWLKEHPKAARLGRSMLKQFGGQSSGDDRPINALKKRKEIVSRKISGKPAPRKTKPAAPKSEPLQSVAALREARQKKATKKESAVAERIGPKAGAGAKEKPGKEVKAEERPGQKVPGKEKTQAKVETPVIRMTHPSLFVITLRYLVPLERIDAAMRDHMTFLKIHFEKGEFLLAGRQIPRTGGIIIAKGKDRDTIERIMKNDPFLKKRLASVDIVEFSASSVAKGFKTAITH